MSKVRLSNEERQVSLKIATLTFLVCILLTMPIEWLAGWLSDTEPERIVLSVGFWIGATGTAAFLGQCRWPGTITLQSEITIAAEASKIWDTIRLAHGKAYYKPTVQRIERLNDPAEVYLLHYFSDRRCNICGLLRQPDEAGFLIRLEILEARSESFMLMRAARCDVRKSPRWTAMDHEDIATEIIPTGVEGSRVKNTSRVVRPTIALAVLLKLGDPMGQNLAHLRAYLEGIEDDTWLGAIPARIAAVHSAAKFCCCPVDK